MKKTFLVILLFVSVLGVGVVAISFCKIYSDVKMACQKAQQEYHQDRVSSLIEVVKSDKPSFRERNTAIWALGQLADKRALPFLEELDKSLPPQTKCVYGQYLCKYEVQKAIRWCRQGNVTSWMYHGLPK